MKNATVVGTCIVILGIMLAVNGYTATPQRWFLFAAGAIFVVGGIVHIVRAQRTRLPR